MLMESRVISLSEAARALCDHLECTGLRDLLACFDPLHPRHAHWRLAREAASGEQRAAIDLFILGGAVPRQALSSLPQDAIAALEVHSLLRETDAGDLWLGGLMLLPVQGLWLLCHLPKPNPTLYFGDDSVGLAMRLSAGRGMKALDLCAGPGIQALRMAQMGAAVTAVEINPMAAALAEVNAAANDLADRVEVRIGNLYEALDTGARFDRITANPPLLPMPEDMPYPFVGHGGPDGLDVTMQILEGLPDHLAPHGIARLLGTSFSDGYLPLSLDVLAAMASKLQLDINFYITSHHALHDGAVYFEGLAATSAGTGDIDLATARAHYRNFLDARGATHLVAYFIHATRGEGKFHLVDVATDPPGDLWFVT